MTDAEVEQVEGASVIRVVVDPGVLDRRPDAGARGEIEDAVEGSTSGTVRAPGAKDAVETGAVADVDDIELEPLPAPEPVEAPVLEAHIVRIVQVVDAYDLVAALEQLLYDHGADEPRRPRHQIPHPSSV